MRKGLIQTIFYLLAILPPAWCETTPRIHQTASKPLPAFPGAIGFGSTTVGGSGRNLSIPATTVFFVTSLADSGANTLRACAEASGPRVCIFETSGRIALLDKIEITQPYITIAGQTAPAPGVLITGAGLKITTHDVVVRHLAVRIGDSPAGQKPSDRDGINISAAFQPTFNVIVDHVSVSWSIDENVDFHAAPGMLKDVTFSNSIVSEALYHSIHPKGPHSMGMLINEGVRQVSVIGCLLAHNNDRNPRQKADSSLEFINNLVYNWGGFGGGHQANPSDSDRTNKETLINLAGNFYQPGPDSPKRAPLYAKPVSVKFRAFVEHNIGPTRPSDSGNEWLIAEVPEIPYRSLTPAFPPSGVNVRNPSETRQNVLSRAGTRPTERNLVDSRIVKEVQDNTGTIRDCIFGCTNNVGGWPSVEVNVTKHTLPAAPNKDSNKNGYTDLEDWLNCLAQMVEEGTPSSCPV